MAGTVIEEDHVGGGSRCIPFVNGTCLCILQATDVSLVLQTGWRVSELRLLGMPCAPACLG